MQNVVSRSALKLRMNNFTFASSINCQLEFVCVSQCAPCHCSVQIVCVNLNNRTNINSTKGRLLHSPRHQEKYPISRKSSNRAPISNWCEAWMIRCPSIEFHSMILSFVSSKQIYNNVIRLQWKSCYFDERRRFVCTSIYIFIYLSISVIYLYI